MKRLKQHSIWGQRGSFVLAATGSAVGLGSLWKFPYMTGENGGGAFVLMYLAFVLLIGIPIMMAEIFIGRHGRANPITATYRLAEETGSSKAWSAIGWLGAIAGLAILSFYTVIAGWTLDYLLQSLKGAFAGLTGDSSQILFDELQSDSGRLLLWHSVFSLMTIAVLALGVTRGLENAVRWMMPLLFVLLLIVLGYAIGKGEALTSVRFLFNFTPHDITWETTLAALGHAFFTLSLGMGAIMAYGAYMPSNQSLGATAFTVVVLDTLVALVAGVAIFSLVFATPGILPSDGPGLMFVTLPVAFGTMDAGLIIAPVFFAMLALAAWTSTISLLEPGVAYLNERFGWSRPAASASLGAAAWLLGIASLLSFNHWQQVQWLWGKNIFASIDFIATNILLPVGGLLVALFVGWKVSEQQLAAHVKFDQSYLLRLWRFALRYLAPLAVLLVLINGIFPLFRGLSE